MTRCLHRTLITTIVELAQSNLYRLQVYLITDYFYIVETIFHTIANCKICGKLTHDIVFRRLLDSFQLDLCTFIHPPQSAPILVLSIFQISFNAEIILSLSRYYQRQGLTWKSRMLSTDKFPMLFITSLLLTIVNMNQQIENFISLGEFDHVADICKFEAGE